MDQKKIGRFIANCRKNKKLTQIKLAEMLNITDRAVSKWERGKSLPDASVMLKLCEILDIKVNELLMGEKIMENNEQKLNEIIVELAKQKEEAHKQLLKLEIVLGVLSTVLLSAFVLASGLFDMKTPIRIILIISGFVLSGIGFSFAIKIEQVAGYYECARCHHKYIPTLRQTTFSMHIGRTRYMECPNCNQKSWQKKVISKD